VFDEPSAGLDPIVAAELDELILALKKAFQMTVLVVTHEMSSAFRIADRMAMLYKGSLIAVGTREELQSSSHPRIRQFLDRVPDRIFRTDSTHESLERYLEGGFYEHRSESRAFRRPLGRPVHRDGLLRRQRTVGAAT